jgi:hypothetical protein
VGLAAALKESAADSLAAVSPAPTFCPRIPIIGLVWFCSLGETLKKEPVIPAKAGIQQRARTKTLGSRFRGNDETWFVGRSLPATLH